MIAYKTFVQKRKIELKEKFGDCYYKFSALEKFISIIIFDFNNKVIITLSNPNDSNSKDVLNSFFEKNLPQFNVIYTN